ncbi:MAG: hypothetical protein MUC36_11100 [Planctomycetes bacterium]|nr:hypothetical protein [Planctomycetota bacterium]
MLSELQRVLVQALRTPDPRGWLQAYVLQPDCTLSATERTMVAALPDDGLRLTRLIVRKLRMQRLLQADGDANRLCTQEPARFAKQFAAYDAAVPLQSIFPSDEAKAFRSWLAAARARGEIE